MRGGGVASPRKLTQIRLPMAEDAWEVWKLQKQGENPRQSYESNAKSFLDLALGGRLRRGKRESH